MAERVFTVTLLKDALVANSHVRHDAEAGIVEDRGVTLRFAILSVFKLAEDDNS